VVHKAEDLAGLFEQAQRESLSAFGSPDIFVEKFIPRPRHIEVQLLGDKHGNLVHLFERDCSVQRRHQKVVEIAPAPFLDPKIRDAICEAAIKIGRAVGYQNAGTVEFLFDTDHNKFYFIEVNARIQVEHPVSEMITGIDLIKSQIRVAAGEPLPFKQKSIPQMGSAIEARINAEDPSQGFRGSPGTITKLRIPGGLGVRFDSHVYQGYKIGPYYDSMIGKLIVHKPSRTEAIACMKRCLDEFIVEGIKTTIPLLKRILNNSAFVEGRMDTTFIEQKLLVK